MSDSKKSGKGEKDSNPDVPDEHPYKVAIPKTPEEKDAQAPLSKPVEDTMLIKREDVEFEADEDIGSVAAENGEMVIIGKDGPLLSEAAHKPGIDYLSDVAQDRRSLEGTRARSVKARTEGEQTRIIDRSDMGENLGKSGARSDHGETVRVGKPKGGGGDKEETVEELAEKVKKAANITETVNLPRGADAIKAIAKLAEEARKAKEKERASQTSDDEEPTPDE